MSAKPTTEKEYLCQSPNPRQKAQGPSSHGAGDNADPGSEVTGLCLTEGLEPSTCWPGFLHAQNKDKNTTLPVMIK